MILRVCSLQSTRCPLSCGGLPGADLLAHLTHLVPLIIPDLGPKPYESEDPQVSRAPLYVVLKCWHEILMEMSTQKMGKWFLRRRVSTGV